MTPPEKFKESLVARWHRSGLARWPLTDTQLLACYYGGLDGDSAFVIACDVAGGACFNGTLSLVSEHLYPTK